MASEREANGRWKQMYRCRMPRVVVVLVVALCLPCSLVEVLFSARGTAREERRSAKSGLAPPASLPCPKLFLCTRPAEEEPGKQLVQVRAGGR